MTGRQGPSPAFATRLRHLFSCLAATLTVVGGLPVMFAQHGGDYERADIERGARMYDELCSNCHGDEGDGVGNVNLKAGRFRQASTDQNFRRILTRGIPGTAMPPGDYDDGELLAIIAYVRTMRDYDGGVVTLGDADRGRVIFEGKGDCMRCHRVAGDGSRLAPDLTAIGAIRGAGSMRETLIDPSGSMLPFNKPVRIETQGGETVSGRRLNEDTYFIQILDEEERLRSFDKTDLRELTVLTTSPMPSYAESLTETEMADLLAYLVTLKGL